ncbi:MAG: ATP-binding cassette domain-containing protein [Gordonia sp. (in: high G+C Gram-positive bacteria)]|uniref:ABC transporter ATP-binding protein n=1 Tax=Gordonia sp. (in: high G+C Gram-positive bacteria) TaxID=84139 RepID=UPI0039E69611
MLSVSGAARRIGDQRLFTDLSLELDRGSCAAVVGPNGAGKSSLLRCIVDDDLLDAGTVTIDGRPPNDRSPDFRSLVAVELGDQAAYFDVTLAEHLTLLAAAHRMVRPDVIGALRDAGLAALHDRFPHTLSTGQGRRFALAALFLRPSGLIVIDEPELGLDTDGQEWVAEKITAAKESGRAVLIATHSPLLVERCADTVLALGDGADR